jgi:hypothetical protein
VQQTQPLGHNFSDEKIDAGNIAARPRKARDQTQLHRIFDDAKYDGGRRGRSFGCKRSGSEGRGDHGHAAADQIGHDRRHAIVLAFKPMVLHHHVLALDIAGPVKAFTERSGWARGSLGRPAGDKTDDRDRRLLRARRERPGRRAA